MATFLINFEYHPCGIFEDLSYHQEDGAINPTIFAYTVGLVDRIKSLVSSTFMGLVSSVSVIFDMGAAYSCSSNKGDIVNIEEKFFPRKLKGIEKGLEISGFGIVKYSVKSESGRIIALRDQAYYVLGLPMDLRIISSQGIRTSD